MGARVGRLKVGLLSPLFSSVVIQLAFHQSTAPPWRGWGVTGNSVDIRWCVLLLENLTRFLKTGKSELLSTVDSVSSWHGSLLESEGKALHSMCVPVTSEDRPHGSPFLRLHSVWPVAFTQLVYVEKAKPSPVLAFSFSGRTAMSIDYSHWYFNKKLWNKFPKSRVKWELNPFFLYTKILIESLHVV